MYLMFLTKCSGDVRVLSFPKNNPDNDGKMTSPRIRHRMIPNLQYKTKKIRPDSSGAGLSYTVASIGFVGTKPAAKAERGSAPVTPSTIQ